MTLPFFIGVYMATRDKKNKPIPSKEKYAILNRVSSSLEEHIQRIHKSPANHYGAHVMKWGWAAILDKTKTILVNKKVSPTVPPTALLDTASVNIFPAAYTAVIFLNKISTAVLNANTDLLSQYDPQEYHKAYMEIIDLYAYLTGVRFVSEHSILDASLTQTDKANLKLSIEKMRQQADDECALIGTKSDYILLNGYSVAAIKWIISLSCLWSSYEKEIPPFFTRALGLFDQFDVIESYVDDGDPDKAELITLLRYLRKGR